MLDEHAIAARESGRLRKLFDTSLCPMDYGLGRDESLLSVTRFARVELRSIDVIRDEGFGTRAGVRRACHIGPQHEDEFLVCLPHRADVTLAQGGRHTRFGAGSFALLSTARPFSALIASERAHAAFSHTILRIPGASLRARMGAIEEGCGTALAIRPGAGRIMVELCELALSEGHALSDDARQRMGETLLDFLVSAALEAPELAQARLPRPSAKQRLRERAEKFLLSRLSDPWLDADAVADHCSVSPRYLRAAFAEHGQSFGEFMREARLQACRRALRDPALAGHTVTRIAMSWGFNDAAWFSRAYRRRFGIAPRQDRAAFTTSARIVGNL